MKIKFTCESRDGLLVYIALILSLLISCSKKNDAKPVPSAPAVEEKEEQETIKGAAKLANDDCIDPDLSKLLVGESMMMCDGSVKHGTLGLCNKDSQKNCVTTEKYAAADTGAIAEKVIKGQSIAGIAGNIVIDYPSAANVLAGDTVNGTAGEIVSCTQDGQLNCYVTGDLRAAAVNSISTVDIRRGKSIAGINGSYQTDCRNAALLSEFDTTSLPDNTGTSDANASADPWDSYTDFSTVAYPGDKPWGSAHYCGSDIWEDVSTTAADTDTLVDCNGSTLNCAFYDKLTEKTWSEASGSDNKTWQDAFTYCLSLAASNFAGIDDWRLPTIKEHMQAMIHGIGSIRNVDFIDISSPYYWSATTVELTTKAKVSDLSSGLVFTQTKTENTYNAVCVSP